MEEGLPLIRRPFFFWRSGGLAVGSSDEKKIKKGFRDRKNKKKHEIKK